MRHKKANGERVGNIALAIGAEAILKEPDVKKCEAIAALIGNADPLRRATADLDAVKIFNTRESSDAMLIGANPQAAWLCATEKIAEAERPQPTPKRILLVPEEGQSTSPLPTFPKPNH